VLLLGAVAGWLGYHRLYGEGGDRVIGWRDVTPAVSSARFPRPTERVIESSAELAELFPEAPAIDFARRRAVLAALGPRSSSGFEVKVESVREERRRIVVVVRERSPELGHSVQPRVTYPFRLITVPRGDKPVEVEGTRR
jgi:PrcB C-terminal